MAVANMAVHLHALDLFPKDLQALLHGAGLDRTERLIGVGGPDLFYLGGSFFLGGRFVTRVNGT